MSEAERASLSKNTEVEKVSTARLEVTNCDGAFQGCVYCSKLKSLEGVICTNDHFQCDCCFNTYIMKRNEELLRNFELFLRLSQIEYYRCPVDGCSSPSPDPRTIALHTKPEVFDNYMNLIRTSVAHHAKDEIYGDSLGAASIKPCGESDKILTRKSISSKQALTQTLIAGDSFVGIFTLLRKEAKVKVIKYKGATAKGLTRFDNANRQSLLQLTAPQKHPYKHAIFGFGQVDIHFRFDARFYYDSIKAQAPLDVNKYYKDLATHYADFIASLKGINKKIVLAIYPCPVETTRIPQQLVTYGVMKLEEALTYPKELWWEMLNPTARRNRLDSFNRSLAAACASQGIEFATLNDRIMDQYGTIDGAFIDASPYNIHLLWEPLMDLWTRKFADYGIDVTPDLLTDITSTAQSYTSEKAKQQAVTSDDMHRRGPLRPLVDFLERMESSSSAAAGASARLGADSGMSIGGGGIGSDAISGVGSDAGIVANHNAEDESCGGEDESGQGGPSQDAAKSEITDRRFSIKTQDARQMIRPYAGDVRNLAQGVSGNAPHGSGHGPHGSGHGPRNHPGRTSISRQERISGEDGPSHYSGQRYTDHRPQTGEGGPSLNSGQRHTDHRPQTTSDLHKKVYGHGQSDARGFSKDSGQPDGRGIGKDCGQSQFNARPYPSEARGYGNDSDRSEFHRQHRGWSGGGGGGGNGGHGGHGRGTGGGGEGGGGRGDVNDDGRDRGRGDASGGGRGRGDHDSSRGGGGRGGGSQIGLDWKPSSSLSELSARR